MSRTRWSKYRFAFNLWWEAIAHPNETSVIDTETGKVVERRSDGDHLLHFRGKSGRRYP